MIDNMMTYEDIVEPYIKEDLDEVKEINKKLEHFKMRLGCRMLEKNKPMQQAIESVQAFCLFL